MGGTLRSYISILVIVIFLLVGISDSKNLITNTQTKKHESYLSKALPSIIHFQGSFDEETNKCSKISINYENKKGQIIITNLEDYFVEDSKNGAKKTIFREPQERAYFISEYEAKQIEKCNYVIIRMLEELDQCLLKKEWGHLQGLDSYFMRFLKNYNILICCSTNNTVFLFSHKYDYDSLYDISMDLGKLDSRINNWRIDVEFRSKLHTVTKELLFQCRIWQKKLQQDCKTGEILINEGLVKAMNIFTDIYFD